MYNIRNYDASPETDYIIEQRRYTINAILYTLHCTYIIICVCRVETKKKIKIHAKLYTALFDCNIIIITSVYGQTVITSSRTIIRVPDSYLSTGRELELQSRTESQNRLPYVYGA